MTDTMNDTTPSAVTSASDVVRAIYAAFGTTDPDKIAATTNTHFAEDVIVREAESLPWGGDYVGRDTVAEMTVGLADPAAPIDAANLQIDELIESPPDADGLTHVIAAVSFPWRGPNETIPMRALEWFSLRDNKVVEIQIFLWDVAAALAALAPEGGE